MLRRNPLVFALVAAVSVATALSTLAGNEANPAEARIRELMMQKRDVLQQRIAALEQFYKNGQVTHADVLNAKIELLTAELDLAANKNERLGVLESQLQLFRRLEKVAQAQFLTGEALHTEVLQAKAARIDAEIALLLAKE